jgi:hypothetical protein
MVVVTTGTRTAYPSGAPESTLALNEVLVPHPSKSLENRHLLLVFNGQRGITLMPLAIIVHNYNKDF